MNFSSASNAETLIIKYGCYNIIIAVKIGHKPNLTGGYFYDMIILSGSGLSNRKYMEVIL